MKVLVLGASGLLGHVVSRILGNAEQVELFATARKASDLQWITAKANGTGIQSSDLADVDELRKIVSGDNYEMVINCLSLPKSLQQSSSVCDDLYGKLPIILAAAVSADKTRVVSISSDGVFSGKRGCYSELDDPDDSSVYGRAKLKGEVMADHVLNLRLSMLGHALRRSAGFLDWFLDQNDECDGFTKAVFSGLPTLHIAQLIRDVIVPSDNLHGVYNIAAPPISKYELLQIVKSQYGKDLFINPVAKPELDRSLSPEKFRAATGWISPDWPQLIAEMHSDFIENKYRV